MQLEAKYTCGALLTPHNRNYIHSTCYKSINKASSSTTLRFVVLFCSSHAHGLKTVTVRQTRNSADRHSEPYNIRLCMISLFQIYTDLHMSLTDVSGEVTTVTTRPGNLFGRKSVCVTPSMGTVQHNCTPRKQVSCYIRIPESIQNILIVR